MSQYPHEFYQLRPLTEAERRAQRTLAAADQLLNLSRPARPMTECTTAEAELLRYMDELRSRKPGYGHAGTMLQHPRSGRGR